MASLPLAIGGGIVNGLVGCGGSGPTDPHGRLDCSGVSATTMAVGGHQVVDPSLTNGCLRLPAAGPTGAEYLVVALSANGQEQVSGVQGRFDLLASADSFAPAAAPPRRGAIVEEQAPLRFHRMLRERERALAGRARISAAASGPGRLSVPPTVGSQRTFKVCSTAACSGFVNVTATAQYVGARSAVYLDDTVPANGYTPEDLQRLGALFDQQLYPIDTAAFGRESDLDGNGVVVILLTDRINALAPDCQQTGQVILGYFFGLDLDVTDPNANRGEVFYGLVPDPGKPACFGRSFVLDRIAPTAIHEFQHMISFNRHVLLGGGAAEETWLNEGLSHFAEELGGRQVPDSFCTATSCLKQFARADVGNAFDYLLQPVVSYLIEPGSSPGSLRERGANWLFVRWLADRSPADSVLGTEITRRLDGADQPAGITVTGGGNVALSAQAFQPGVTFATLVGEWHLSNYLESVPNFGDPAHRLGYRSWNLPNAFASLFGPSYPLDPDSTAGLSYSTSGTLLGGSGVYLRIVQPANGVAVAVGLETGNTTALMPRLAIARIR